MINNPTYHFMANTLRFSNSINFIQSVYLSYIALVSKTVLFVPFREKMFWGHFELEDVGVFGVWTDTLKINIKGGLIILSYKILYSRVKLIGTIFLSA